MDKEIKRRIELLIYTAIAMVGANWCAHHHRCMCGHLAHDNRYLDWRLWLEDVPGLFSIIAMTIVGLKNQFRFAWIIGALGLVFVIIMFLDRSLFLDPFLLMIMTTIQIWWIVRHLISKKKYAEQAAPSNR